MTKLSLESCHVLPVTLVC